MGKWIAILVLVVVVWIGFRFIQFGARVADLTSAARDMLPGLEVADRDAAADAFVSKADELGFMVAAEDIRVTVEPTDKTVAGARFLPGHAARLVHEEVRFQAPAQYRILGPWLRETRVDVTDVRLVQAIGYSSVDTQPELARELGVAPAPQDPQRAPAQMQQPTTQSTRRARGVYQGAKQRARDLTR